MAEPTDTERLDWLQDHASGLLIGQGPNDPRKALVMADVGLRVGPDIRAAIDAAMARVPITASVGA